MYGRETWWTGVRGAIGIQLTDSCLVIPRKSVSVIEFPTKGSLASCQLCLREQCPSRRVPYEPGLYDEKYRLATAGASAAISGHQARREQQGVATFTSEHLALRTQRGDLGAGYNEKRARHGPLQYLGR